jgi:hypothetical protein
MVEILEKTSRPSGRSFLRDCYTRPTARRQATSQRLRPAVLVGRGPTPASSPKRRRKGWQLQIASKTFYTAWNGVPFTIDIASAREPLAFRRGQGAQCREGVIEIRHTTG